MLNEDASASGAFNKAAENYFKVMNLKQESENRFYDSDQLCVSFISRPFKWT